MNDIFYLIDVILVGDLGGIRETVATQCVLPKESVKKLHARICRLIACLTKIFYGLG